MNRTKVFVLSFSYSRNNYRLHPELWPGDGTRIQGSVTYPSHLEEFGPSTRRRGDERGHNRCITQYKVQSLCVFT